MKEIEVKARIDNEDSLLKKITSLGCVLSEPIRQIDTVYSKIVGTVEDYLKNDHFLRIREKSDGRFIFTVKKPMRNDLLTRTEYETEIKNAIEMEKAILLMGYRVASRLVKVRRISHLKKFEICIDQVDGLGSFIEIEKMSDQDPDLVRRELDAQLLEFGIPTSNQIHKGYDILEIESRKIK